MSPAHSHEDTVPTPALVSAAALVVFALALTATVRLGWLDRAAVPAVERAEAEIAAVAQRSLHFADMPDGSVEISDAASGVRVATIAAGGEQGGFIRGVLRGLARGRRMNGIGHEPAFTLTRWQDGSLSLRDDATGQTIELGAFGADNRAAFAALLASEAGS